MNEESLGGPWLLSNGDVGFASSYCNSVCVHRGDARGDLADDGSVHRGYGRHSD